MVGSGVSEVSAILVLMHEHKHLGRAVPLKQIEEISMNLLINGGFEAGWTRKTHTGVEYGEIFVPEGWTAFWKEGLPVPHDPSNTKGYGRPEMHVIKKEEPYLNPARIFSGNQSLKMFTFYRIHEAGIYQQVTGILPGKTYKAYYQCHAWSSIEDDPFHSSVEGEGWKNFLFQVGIDPTGGTDPWSNQVIWNGGRRIYDVFSLDPPNLEVTAEAESMTVFLRSSVLWPFKHCDAYMDDAVLELVENTLPTVYGYPVIATGPKLHLHAIGQSGADDAIPYMRDKGCPFPFMKIVAPQPWDVLAARNLKALNPDTHFIVRIMRGMDPLINVEGPDFYQYAQTYMNSILPIMRQYKEIDYWELWNEQDLPGEAGHIRMANFAITCMDIAEAEGFKLALMSYSTGVPEPEEWQAIWDETDFFQRAKAGEHILSLHAYGRSRYPSEYVSHVLRPLWLYENILIPGNCVVPYVFTEYSVTDIDGGGIWRHPEYPDPEDLLREFEVTEEALSSQWYCLGASVYLFGDAFSDYCMNSIWKEFCDMLLKFKDRQNALPPTEDEEPQQCYHRYVRIADPNLHSKLDMDDIYRKGRAELVTTTPSWDDAIPRKADRPAAWLTNTVNGGPVYDEDTQEEYLAWVAARDPGTVLLFDSLPQVPFAFSQLDTLWGSIYLGESPYTMAQYGCLVTAYASLFTTVDSSVTPYNVVNYLNQHNGFLADGRLMIAKPFGMYPEEFEYLGYHTWREEGQVANLSLVLDKLSVAPVIIQVDYKPGTSMLDSHFVLALREVDGDIVIMDPWAGDITLLMPRYGRGTLEQSIFAMIDYRITTGETKTDTLIGINDPEDLGARHWLEKGMVVVPVQLLGGPLQFDYTDEDSKMFVELRYHWSTDCGGAGTLPLPGAGSSQFVRDAIATIRASKGVAGWIIANEYNNPREFPRDGSLNPQIVADTYNAIRAGVADLGPKMAPGAVDPFNALAGDPRDWLRQVYERILGAEFTVFHGYTRGPNPDYEAMFTDPPLEGWQYLSYPGCVTALRDEALPVRYKDLPLYVTEFNHILKDNGEPGWNEDERVTELVKRSYAQAVALSFAGLIVYRWEGDAWAIRTNEAVKAAIGEILRGD